MIGAAPQGAAFFCIDAASLRACFRAWLELAAGAQADLDVPLFFMNPL
ncbi:hypothetical protein [Nevskia soli]|nr:hypothetical protein [Nevskia soli]